jgi:hypothetical protein
MAGLLGEKDPVVLAIALEALALARDDSALKVEPAILKLHESTDDLQVKEFTLYALLRLSRGEGESGARAVRELFEEFQARSKVEMLPRAYLDSPLVRLKSLGYVSRPGLDKPPPVVRRPGVPGRSLPPQRVPPGPRITSMTQTLEWVLNQAGEKLLLQLYPQVLSHSGTAEGAAFHEWFLLEMKDRTPALKVLIDRLDSLSGPEIRESVIGMIWTLGHSSSGEILKFLEAAVRDRALSTETRLKAFFWPENPNFDWLEWQRFFKSDDPLVGSFFAGLEQQPNLPGGNVYARFQKGRQQFSFNFWSWVSGRPDEEKAAIQDAALKSPHEAVRASAVHSVNRAEEPEFLRKALADPSPLVKSAAIHRLENTTRADVAPLVIELLGDNENRLAAIKILKRFADPRSIEPLVKLLDDPDTQVRSEARAALKEIRAALEEKREWEQVLKGLKPSPSEKPKGF